MSGAGRSLRVQERDGFFDDSFFRDAWDDFDRAMQSVLDRFDTTGLNNKASGGTRSECRDAYAKIRSSKIDEDLYASQALQITEKDGKFQVVMDVKDFNPRELQVRAVDDRIMVEGAYQKVSQDGVSSACKSFYKEFALPPAADLDHVTTALSRDGVLTIRAPRKEGAYISDTTSRAPISSTSSSSTQQHQHQQQQHGDNGLTSTSSSLSSRKVVQSSSSFDSCSDTGFDSLSRDMRERLMFSDSGFGSNKTSTCSSPVPSEANSETSSRVSSTMEFDLSKRAPVKTEVAFNVSKPNQPPQQGFPSSHRQHPNYHPQSPPPSATNQPYHQHQQHQFNQSYNQFQQYDQSQPTAGVASPQFPQSPPPPPQSQRQYQSPTPSQYVQSPPPPQQPQYCPQSPPPPPQSQQQQQYYQQPSQFTQYNPTQQYAPPPPPPQQHHNPASQFSPANKPQQTTSVSAAMGTGRQTSVNVSEENGRRVVTSQLSDVLQEKDGFKERRETTAEITDKDSQAARREASTKESKVEADPQGKFKRAESKDAEEVSESCVQHLPDGSIMSVKKNSTSSSTSFKQSFSGGLGKGGSMGGSSNSGDLMGNFFGGPSNPNSSAMPGFPAAGFDDFRNFMGMGSGMGMGPGMGMGMNRGYNLMSQLSTDSMGSTLSGRSGFTDMSNFSNFSSSDASSSNFSSDMSGNMKGFGGGGMPMNFAPPRPRNFQQPQQQQQQQYQQEQQQYNQQQQQQDFGSPRRKAFTTSSSTSSTSSFNQSFSSYGDGTDF